MGPGHGRGSRGCQNEGPAKSWGDGEEEEGGVCCLFFSVLGAQGTLSFPTPWRQSQFGE